MATVGVGLMPRTALKDATTSADIAFSDTYEFTHFYLFYQSSCLLQHT
ncbi:MAG: hypothetical protein ABSH28_01020 [Acidobacteriota bacterium]|jgi:hypothetical protein